MAALADDRHIGEVHELTSPRLLTFADAVGEIAKATDRDMRYVPITVQEYAAGSADHGVPPRLRRVPHLPVQRRVGPNAYLTDGVQRAWGRQPRHFSDYVRDTAAAGVWDAPATSPAAP